MNAHIAKLLRFRKLTSTISIIGGLNEQDVPATGFESASTLRVLVIPAQAEIENTLLDSRLRGNDGPQKSRVTYALTY